MYKKSLILSSFFLISISSIIYAQQKAKLLCLNDCTVQPSTVFLFAHGITLRSDTAQKQAQAYIDSNIITAPCYTFDFGDGLRTINLGQENDCALFKDAFEQVSTKHPDAAVILVGLSRGAVTILNTLALYPDLNVSKVRCAILESPYAHVHAIAEQIASSYMFFIPFKQTIMRKLVDSLPAYKPDGIQPIDMIAKINVHFPFLICYAENDKTVPASDTMLLIEKLRSSGHCVTSWSTKKAKHSMLGSNAAFSQEVRKFLLAFI